jgi:hypothetical protein
MSQVFDFGFETRGVEWKDAVFAFLFPSGVSTEDLGSTAGPTAIADASRFVELFEMQVGLSPLNMGSYAELLGGPSPLEAAVERARQAMEQGSFPIVVSETRRAAELMSTSSLVALWGKIGRKESDETALIERCQTLVGGVRAASSIAFQAIPPNVGILTARAFEQDRKTLEVALERMSQPVHLSIDLDVLNPGIAQNRRSVEPGGLSWYGLMDGIEIIFQKASVQSVDLCGTGFIEPRSPAAVLCAQILVRLAGLVAAGLEK